jgi:hypothetical protein
MRCFLSAFPPILKNYLGQFAFFLMLAAPQADAQTVEVERNPSRLAPFFNIINKDVYDFAISVGYVFSISDLSAYFSTPINQMNLIFISQPVALQNGKINRKFLDIFDAPTQNEILKIDVETDECLIQPIKIDQKSVILAINTAENGSIEIDKKCFLLALVFLSGQPPDDVANLSKMSLNDAVFYVLENSKVR